TVECSDLYNVKITESRKVTGVEVRVGDTVAVGDVICYLEDVESEELKAARAELEAAQQAYDAAVLAGGLSVDNMQNAGYTESTSSYRNQLIEAQKVVEDIEAALDTQEEAYNTAKAAKDAAAMDLTEKQNTLANLDNWLNYQNDISSGNAGAAALREQRDVAQQLYLEAQNTANAANLEFSKVEAERAELEADLAEAEAEVERLAADINTAISLGALKDTVEKAEDKVESLESQSIGATVTAEIAGTITSLSVRSGEYTSPDVPVAVIQPEGKGFTLSFSVTNEQAKQISVGDPAELVNSWWYEDVTATVASIKPDPTDPAKKKLVTFNLTGELIEGQSLSLQVGEKSQNYEMIVPNSAVREDNNGKFILIVEAKSSPLGTRYYAVRYDIEVLASDDTQSAITGAYGYEYVITTSTKPVEAGQLVRLPD
ncbi:MAG: HlyD family efflux transporter periplasmic adaptor subunit, partial [Lachnospiraceae bacterium]|nr:HlyD family efflux transporter periplasmic adaptor subunit [Lachnospiraceae bacterium]